MPKITIGVVLYGTKYLKETLPTLIDQDYENIEFIFRDQQEGQWEATELIEKELPEVAKRAKIIKGDNRWHSGGHNEIINQMSGDIYICASNDMLYPKNLASQFAKAFLQNPNYQVATCKSLQMYDQNTIDSCGLIPTNFHHFYDRGQGQKDQGQFDHLKEVWGSSGALFAITKQAIQDIKYKNEYFDELIHYRNDIDLAYRLRWAGHKCLFLPKLKVYHDRQVSTQKSKSLFIKESSLLGDLVVLKKNFSQNHGPLVTLKTHLYHLLKRAYLLATTPKLFKVFKKYKQIKPEILAKKKAMNKKVTHKTVLE